jgi:hypothetical protein
VREPTWRSVSLEFKMTVATYDDPKWNATLTIETGKRLLWFHTIGHQSIAEDFYLEVGEQHWLFIIARNPLSQRSKALQLAWVLRYAYQPLSA